MSTSPTVVLQVVVPLDQIQWPQAAAVPEPVDTSGTLTETQRVALFAAFRDVFGSTRSGARYVFTNLILGNAPNTQVSWATWKHGSITRTQASTVLDALKALSEAI